MNGCIYRTKDGECDLYAEGGKFTAFCEMENCAGRKMSNADCIKAMSDEELAEWVCCHITECSRCEGQNYDGETCEFRNEHFTGLVRWLKSPAEGEP